GGGGGGRGAGGGAGRRRRVTAPGPTAPAGPTLDDLREAAAGLAGAAVRTRVVEAPFLAAVAGVPVAVQCEFEQPMGAVKARRAAPGASSPTPAATTARRWRGRRAPSASAPWWSCPRPPPP